MYVISVLPCKIKGITECCVSLANIWDPSCKHSIKSFIVDFFTFISTDLNVYDYNLITGDIKMLLY